MHSRKFLPIVALMSLLVLGACGGGSGSRPNAAAQIEDARKVSLADLRNPETEPVSHRVDGSGASARVVADGLSYYGDPYIEDDIGWRSHILVDNPNAPSEVLAIYTSTDTDTLSPLSFGYWAPGLEFGETVKITEIAVFHDGPAYTATNLDALTGTATYNGVASRDVYVCQRESVWRLQELANQQFRRQCYPDGRLW